MRLSWSQWLLLPLLCSASCETADNCGPTSEWPTCNNGSDGEPTAPSTDDNDDGDDDKPTTPVGGGKKDAGKTTVGAMDAGASVRDAATAPPSTGGDSEASSGDSGTGDGGTGDGGVTDARVDTIDGGSSDCTVDSDGRDGGACYGVYCSVPQADFSRLSSAAGACSGDDLALACDGEISRVVSQCAQDDVFALGFGRTVAICAGRAPSLAKASEGCVSCYVDEVLCALQNCLAPCLNGDAEACTECRLESCGLDFRTCSGLPVANEHVVVDYID